MQGTAHAANKKEEYPPAPTRVPKPAEKGQQVPVRAETPQQKMEQDVSAKLAALARKDFSDLAKAIKAPSLDVEPLIFDSFYMELPALVRDQDFLDFRKARTTLQLPPEGTAAYESIINLRSIESPYFQVNVDFQNKTVEISNIVLEAREAGKAILPALEKILASGNDEAILMAQGCLQAIISARRMQSSLSAEWGALKFESGMLPDEARDLLKEIYSLQEQLVALYSNRIASIAKSGAPAEPSAAEQKLLGKINSAEENFALLKLNLLMGKLTGKDAIERTEKGIEAGLYSAPEIAFYQQAKAELEAALKKAQLNQLKGKTDSQLSETQREILGTLLNLVNTLEVIAWKQDAAELTFVLQSRAGKSLLLGGIQGGATLSMRQFETNAREQAAFIAEKAVAYCDLFSENLKNVQGFTLEDRLSFSARIYEEKENLKNLGVAGPLAASSSVISKIGDDAAIKLSERYEEMNAKNPKNPWYVRTSSYAKMYVLRNAIPIEIGASAVGAAVGGVATRSAGGAWVGAKAGFWAGGLVVGSAAAFSTGEAFYRYVSATSPIQKDQALEDMRNGVIYMGFALGGGVGAAGRAISIAAGGLVTASSAFLAYEDIRAGNYFNVASDVVYIAMGSVAFLRIGGGFKAIALKNDLGDAVIVASSSGISRASLGLKVQEFMAKPLSAGYSIPWFSANVGFASLGAYPELETAIQNKDPGAFMHALSKSFAETTAGMVTFEFAIAGAGAAASAGASRIYRLAVSRSDAKMVSYLKEQGLFDRVAQIAEEGKISLDGEKYSRLVENAFGSKGRVSAEYVQASLGISDRAIAERIANEISTSWADARMMVSRVPKTKAFVLKQMQKFEDARLRRVAAIAGTALNYSLLIGGIGYMEAKNLGERKLDKNFSKLLSGKETDFISLAISPATSGFTAQGLEYPAFREALKSVQNLAEKVADGESELSEISWLKNASPETRERFLYSCAIALLINGRGVSEKEISSLAFRLEDALSASGVPVSKDTGVDMLSLLASALLLKGEGSELDFSQFYSDSASGFPNNQRGAFLDYAVSVFYSMAKLGKDEEWGKAVSSSAFTHNMGQGRISVYSLWSLPLAFQFMNTDDLSDAKVSSAMEMGERTSNGVLTGNVFK